MKPNRFLWLFSLLLAANAVTYFFSCQQDEAAPLTPKTLSHTPVGERACLDDDYCSWVITATTNAEPLDGDTSHQCGGTSCRYYRYQRDDTDR